MKKTPDWKIQPGVFIINIYESLRLWVDRNLLAGFIVAFESNNAWNESVDREVTTEAYVTTWVELRSTLTNDDFACLNKLTTEALHAQHLRIRVTTVTGTTTGFFVCHVLFRFLCYSFFSSGWLRSSCFIFCHDFRIQLLTGSKALR